MKKILSMALASAMVASMAATAFAADPSYKIAIDPNAAAPVHTNVFKWDSDNEVIADNGGNDIAFGKTAYYALKDTSAGHAAAPTKTELVYEYDAVKGLKLKETWTMNGSLVEKVEIVKKKIDADVLTALSITDTTPTPEYAGARLYAYFVAVTLKDSTSVSEKFVNGEIKLKKSKGKNVVIVGTRTTDALDYDDNKFEVALDVKFIDAGSAADSDNAVVNNTKKTFVFEDGKTNSLGEDEEFNLTIINDDTAYFEVDTRGQGKLVISATNKFDADIAAKFDADLNFIKTNGATFNRTGNLYIYAEEGSYLYEIKADGTLVKSKAKYDDVEEAFVLKTRTLGNYVISSEELDLSGSDNAGEEVEVVEPGTDVEVVPAPVNPNPSTGAAA